MRTALITGGTRGIGRAIADCLSWEGYKVIVTGFSNTKDTIHSCLQADLSNDEGIDKLTKDLSNLSIDICVNCAGANIIKQFSKCSVEDYDYINTLLLKAPYLITQKVSEHMIKQRWGRVVNIASIWSVISKAKRSLYTSAKTGLIGQTRSLAVELAPHNILVNAVSPGFTYTELTRKSLSKRELKAIEKQIPIGRMATPDEIAKAVLYLVSEGNTYLTGQNIVVDGGFTNV
jgi:3-oxoacyl-[acyl-carrier protein] reductase